jgi:hypothetical protein
MGPSDEEKKALIISMNRVFMARLCPQAQAGGGGSDEKETPRSKSDSRSVTRGSPRRQFQAVMTGEEKK